MKMKNLCDCIIDINKNNSNLINDNKYSHQKVPTALNIPMLEMIISLSLYLLQFYG